MRHDAEWDAYYRDGQDARRRGLLDVPPPHLPPSLQRAWSEGWRAETVKPLVQHSYEDNSCRPT